MKNIFTILNDYRKGTPEVRLNLCLFHRDLRREFIEIENDESASINGSKPIFELLRKHKRVTNPLRAFKKRFQPAG